MANVSVYQTSWVSMEGSEMYPGERHYWSVFPLGYLDAWAVTAVPVVGGPDTSVLSVEDVTVTAASGSRSFDFTVTNVGASYIDGYGLNVSMISP